MSRIGRMPIKMPAGVNLTVDEGNLITVKGPMGTLSQRIKPQIKVEIDNGEVNVIRPTDEKEHRSLHGLSRTLINNMVLGVTQGFSKTLEISGVGYRAQKQGKQLIMNLGYSHQVIIDEIDGINIEVPANNRVIVKGIDKQKVGQFASEIKGKRPAEPYGGKGIKYQNEVIRRKEGKTGVKK